MKKTRSIPSQKPKKKVNVLKYFIFVLFVAGLGLLGYYFFTLYSAKPFDPTQVSGSHQYLLETTSSDTQKTLVVIESEINGEEKISDAFVFLTNKEKQKSIMIYLPSWLYWSGLEESFGNSISVGSFKYAGDFLQEGRGVEYAIWQISQLLGIKVDDYIWFTPSGYSSYTQLYGDISSVSENIKGDYLTLDDDTLSESFFKLHTMSSRYSWAKSMTNIKDFGLLSNYIYSNLTYSQAISFVSQLQHKVEGTETYGIDLSYSRYSTESLATSGGQIRYVNTDEFDTVYRELIANIIDKKVEKERARVEVYNGSGISGVAQQFGRKIENSGCDVVRYENAPSTITRTVVYVPNKSNFENSFAVVTEVLGSNYDVVEGRPSFMTTGDIVVVLGEDIKQMYSF